MAKLTKKQLKLHTQALEILSKQQDLKFDEVDFVLDNWQPSASDVTEGQAFFTPEHTAYGLAMNTYHDGHIVDMCAGIGRLCWEILRHNYSNPDPLQLTAIELNPAFVEVGKKIMPQVNWIEGSVLSEDILDSVNASSFVANPPFNLTWYSTDDTGWLSSTKGIFAVVEAGLRKTSEQAGTVILPTNAVPFEYSGKRSYKEKDRKELHVNLQKLLRTKEQHEETWTGYVFEKGTHWSPVSFDTTIGEEGFQDTKISVEIAHVEVN